MDKKTLDAYNANPAGFASDWLSQPTPTEIHRAVKSFFIPNGATADIGAGSGRDAAWLFDQGFPCVGFDASVGLLNAASERFPHLIFRPTKLPALREIASHSFHNVLCETVIMHLPASEHLEALENLFRVLVPGGILSLSWRHAIEGNRDEHGRLYESVDAAVLIELAGTLSAELCHRSTFVSSSSGKKITHFVFRAPPA